MRIIINLIGFLISLNYIYGQDSITCIHKNDFQDSCNIAFITINKFIEGKELSINNHRNIINCYNKLLYEVGLHVHEYKRDDGLLKNDDANIFLMPYFEKLDFIYQKYINQLKAQFGEEYGQGGALYIKQLKLYPINPSGIVFYHFCD